MTEKTDKKRDAPISYRPPADLADEFRRRVEASGLPVNAYITRADLQRRHSARHPPSRRRKSKCSRICSPAPPRSGTLWTMPAASPARSRMIEAAEAAYAELKIIAAALMKMMERTP